MWLVSVLKELHLEEGHLVAVTQDFSVYVGKIQHDFELEEEFVDVVRAVVLALYVC